MKIGLLVDSHLSREAKYLLKNMDIDKVYVQVFNDKRKTNKITNICRKVSFKIISVFESFLLELDDVEFSDDIKTTTLDLTYQPFDTGEFTFPELEFAVKVADSLKILKTNEFILNIESVITDSTESIKDVADPLPVNLQFFDYFIPFLVIILIILAVKYLINFIQNSNKDISDFEVVDDRPAYIIALELLRILKEDDLITKGDFLNFYFRISLILRLFIELHYKINSVEMTTSEIRANLVLADHSEKSEILKFLMQADMIKFAKAIPTNSDSEVAMNWLENYLKSFEKFTTNKSEQKQTKKEN
jgi:hypothetical protein